MRRHWAPGAMCNTQRLDEKASGQRRTVRNVEIEYLQESISVWL
jgi:hypothetical protein